MPIRPSRAAWRSAALIAGVSAMLALGPAAAASASLGSVPSDVSAYVADGMIARLDNVYGKNGAGQGIEFDATTKAGPTSRVYEWTADRLRNATTDHPVQLTNNWVVPITIAEKPIGLATIWINPQTTAPELASFDPTPALATAMAAVPATAALVRDNTTHAWLALDAGTVTPLVAGASGLKAPAPVASLKLGSGPAPAQASRDPNTGLGVAIGAVAVVLLVIVVALLLPRRRLSVATAPDAVGASADPVPVPVPETAAEPEPEPEPEPAQVPVLRAPGSSTSPSKPATPVTKPVGSKPGGRASTSSAASAKPRVQKPPAQKPPRPPASTKPAARPTPKPAPKPAPRPKPRPADEPGVDRAPDAPRES